MLGKCFKGVQHLNKKLDSFVFSQGFFLFQVDHKIALITVLQNQIEIICSFFDVIELDNISIVASLQDLDLILKEFHKFSYITPKLYL